MTVTRNSYISAPLPIEKELKTILNAQESLVVFDIGSCEGEDSIKYAKLFPNSKIYSVEALPKNLELIHKNLSFSKINNVEVVPFALSDSNGTAKFYVSSGQPEGTRASQDWDYGNKSSSLLPPSETLSVLPWLKFENAIEVRTTTLRDICLERSITCIDFIHMDVQGAELRVLKGAGALIKNIKVIWLEVEAIPLYEQQPLKKDVEEFMLMNNFYCLKDTVDDVSGDQLYINLDYFSKNTVLLRLFLRSCLNQIKTIK
jgi:FkbM family methyltransferase